jgi:superfamily II DNA or RNA helicase
MEYKRNTSTHDIFITVPFDKDNMDKVVLKRWNIFKERPIQAAGELCYVMRRVANEDPSRLEEVKELIKYHPKVIIFYNFDYELEILRALDIPIGEWNGHKHDAIPKTKTWAYLVQYSAGAEGWNCIETDVTIFYSQNYSYKIMVQAAGRIDRLNTPYSDLYYYHLRSNSAIDLAITKALKAKKNFNVNKFIKEV